MTQNYSVDAARFLDPNSGQKVYVKAADLRHIRNGDPASWAAVSAPLECLTGDPRLFRYLDAEQSGRITPGKILRTIDWLQTVLKDFDLIDGTAAAAPGEINQNTPDGAAIAAAMEEFAPTVPVRLDQVQELIDGIRQGNLIGDGIIAAAAVADSASATLFDDLTACGFKSAVGGREGAGEDDLERFLAAAEAVEQWLEDGQSPELLCRGDRTPSDYRLLADLEPKILEYFDYCDLIRLDPVNAIRFTASADALPMLDLGNRAQVEEFLLDAPLEPPDAEAEIELTGARINPAYQARLGALAELLGWDRLSRGDWQQLMQEFTPYRKYLDACPDAKIAALDPERRRQHLQGPGLEAMRALFAADRQIGDRLSRLTMLEKLLLCRRDLIRLINNFVSFSELLTPGGTSLLQSGDLVIDGRRFRLVFPATAPAAHRKIAGRSYIATIYIKLTRPGQKERNAAAAVTAGHTRNLYPGKHGVYTATDGTEWDAEITDLILEPVSFAEAFTLPFRKLIEFLSGKIDKITQTRLKKLETDFDKEIATPPAAPAPAPSGGINAPAMLLGGGVGLAALGSSFALLLNVIKGVSLLKILFTLLGLALALALPLVISAVYKLRRRNLALFLEASGWAINPQLRLTSRLGRLFTLTPDQQALPEPPRTEEKPAVGLTMRLMIYLALAVTLLAWLTAVWK